MLACVCHPTETALLFKGGPPIAMGPLGTNVKKHQGIVKDISMQYTTPLSSSPTYLKTSNTLLNLRKIERNTKSTKILVNPVCSDSLGSSDESNRSKKITSRWNGKKKRLKADRITSCYKSVDTEVYSDKCDEVSRDTAKEEKKSITCFKLKSTDDKSRLEDDRKSGKENCKNENSSNWKNLATDKPDIISDSQRNSKEIVAEGVDVTNIKDQANVDKTDSTKQINVEVSPHIGIYQYISANKMYYRNLISLILDSSLINLDANDL